MSEEESKPQTVAEWIEKRNLASEARAQVGIVVSSIFGPTLPEHIRFGTDYVTIDGRLMQVVMSEDGRSLSCVLSEAIGKVQWPSDGEIDMILEIPRPSFRHPVKRLRWHWDALFGADARRERWGEWRERRRK